MNTVTLSLSVHVCHFDSVRFCLFIVTISMILNQTAGSSCIAIFFYSTHTTPLKCELTLLLAGPHAYSQQVIATHQRARLVCVVADLVQGNQLIRERVTRPTHLVGILVLAKVDRVVQVWPLAQLCVVMMMVVVVAQTVQMRCHRLDGREC